MLASPCQPLRTARARASGERFPLRAPDHPALDLAPNGDEMDAMWTRHEAQSSILRTGPVAAIRFSRAHRKAAESPRRPFRKRIFR